MLRYGYVCLLNMVIFYCRVALLVYRRVLYLSLWNSLVSGFLKLVDTGYKIMEDLRILVILCAKKYLGINSMTSV